MGSKYTPTSKPKRTNSSVSSSLQKSANRTQFPCSPHSLGNIEPQVYTDTQSKGLTSRIVLYYDKSRKEKPIINRMYNRAEFPLVHFKKSELTYSARRNLGNSPRIKIPAPGLYSKNVCFKITF